MLFNCEERLHVWLPISSRKANSTTWFSKLMIYTKNKPQTWHACLTSICFIKCSTFSMIEAAKSPLQHLCPLDNTSHIEFIRILLNSQSNSQDTFLLVLLMPLVPAASGRSYLSISYIWGCLYLSFHVFQLYIF